jgi:Phage gp6-like head-tail connector protein
MSATVFFQTIDGDDVATLQMQFDESGSPADPTAVTCVVTPPGPVAGAVVHTYEGATPADIIRVSEGLYQLNIPSTVAGMWGYVWIGTGSASDAQAGTWTVGPSYTLNQFYTSVEEVKSRLKITDTNDDDILHGAVQAAARAIEGYCGRFFYQITETRTYRPWTLYELPIDDLVSITQLAVDYDGDGIFESVWTNGVDYELQIGFDEFNAMATGEQQPYTFVRVINAAGGGRFFPFVWPFSRLDRIQIMGTWGWPEVPFGIAEATRQVASEFYKLKDSPFGMVGTSEFGVVRVPKQNPYITKLLTPYVHPRRKVGV